MSGGACPNLDLLERLARGEELPDVRAHCQTCERCAAIVDGARPEDPFLSRVRVLAAPTLGPDGAPRLVGYRLLGVISTGGQGTVYRAVQEKTARPVAIKVVGGIETLSSRQRARAEREAEIAASLRHPNLVTVFESRALADGKLAVVMEYVDGVPLDKSMLPIAWGGAIEQVIAASSTSYVILPSAIHARGAFGVNSGIIESISAVSAEAIHGRLLGRIAPLSRMKFNWSAP